MQLLDGMFRIFHMKYAHVQSALAEEAGGYRTAQWHGVLCGLLCTGRPLTVDLWHRLVDEVSGRGVTLGLPLRRELERLYRTTREELEDSAITFTPLLPGEHEAGLEQRTRALGVWCEAFLFGLASGGVSSETELNDDAKELIGDIVEISRAEADGETPGDDEYYYNELVEYVRVGVLLLNEELNPLPDSEPNLH